MSDIEPAGERPQLDEIPRDGPSRSATNGASAGLLSWIEARTGLGGAIRATFDAPVPSVARWRYALGAALVSSLLVEVFTGFLLMLTYSPSTSTAWGSTFYIDRVLTGGWFLRGLHSFAGHAMIVAVALHLASVVVAGVYRAPRELNWWLGLAMMGLVVGFILTGNALVWDQDGYWAWNIETSIAGGTPVAGPLIKRLVIGGTEMGNATLGRLYGLHVFLLPMLIFLLLRGHVLVSRRHRLVRPEGAMGTIEQGWPRQVYYDLLASAVLLGSVTVLVIFKHGVSLDAPADPASQYPARPAWFFFWLFELRKSFVGPREIIATMVIPGAIAMVMLLLPLLDRVFPRRLAHFLACSFAFAVLGSVSYLTVHAVRDDAADVHYQTALRDSERARDRAVSLALEGIPPEGAAALLTHDPLHHGFAALQEKCLGCHVYNGQGSGQQAASDLQDFGSRAWLRGLLDAPKSPAYFGKASGCGGMARWKKSSKLTAKELDAIADFFVQFVTNTPADLSAAEWDALPGLKEHPGYVAFNKDGECITCHADWSAPSEEAPSLFAWGTPHWISRIILKPAAPDLYGWLDAKHQMPSFAGQLTENDVRTIVRFLKHDYLGAPVAAKTTAARP